MHVIPWAAKQKFRKTGGCPKVGRIAYFPFPFHIFLVQSLLGGGSSSYTNSLHECQDVVRGIPALARVRGRHPDIVVSI